MMLLGEFLGSAVNPVRGCFPTEVPDKMPHKGSFWEDLEKNGLEGMLLVEPRPWGREAIGYGKLERENELTQ